MSRESVETYTRTSPGIVAKLAGIVPVRPHVVKILANRIALEKEVRLLEWKVATKVLIEKAGALFCTTWAYWWITTSINEMYDMYLILRGL